jgi:peptidoglycan hydrolase-like protein with peptidoglycan-binding domain
MRRRLSAASAGRRSARGVIVIGLAATVVAIVGMVAVITEGASDAGPPEQAAKATATAKVARQDLVARTDVDGTLGYAGDVNVLNQAQGTITSLPSEGTVVERGQALYWIDNRPIPLLYGDLPAWRRFEAGMSDGPDVRQLEQNLVALGYATEPELTVDERFTLATAAAVKRWQQAIGVAPTGAVELSDAVFLPDAVRVASVKAERGSAARPGEQILAGTTTGRIVRIDLDATKQALAKAGDRVEVKLPSGRTTTGTIAWVGSVAQTKGQGETAKRVIEVTVTLDDPNATGTIDQAPVKVGITSDSRSGVLAVPVNALLALAEGGYGVRLVDEVAGAPGRIVAVKTGLFARGMVEISGESIAEGVTVEVPAS